MKEEQQPKIAFKIHVYTPKYVLPVVQPILNHQRQIFE